MQPQAPAADGLTATGRVPVEHRVLGLDRRSLLPGLVVIGLFVLWTVVVPGINGLLQYGQQTEAGDVFVLSEGLTMDAQPGWGVSSGLLTTDDPLSPSAGAPVSLSKGGVDVAVVPGPFRGSPRELLTDIEKVDTALQGEQAFHVAGEVQTFHTNAGQPGVAQAYSTVDGVGVVSALVYGETGLKITVTGPAGMLADQGDEVGKMIDSIRFDPSKAR